MAPKMFKRMQVLRGSVVEVVLTAVIALFLTVVLPHQSVVSLPNDNPYRSDYSPWPLNYLDYPLFKIWWPHYLSNLLFSAANSVKDASSTDGTGVRLLPFDDDQFHGKLSDADLGMHDHPLNTWIAFDGRSGGKNSLNDSGVRRRVPQEGPYVDPDGKANAVRSARGLVASAKKTAGAAKAVYDPDFETARALIDENHGCMCFTMDGCPHCDNLKPVLEDLMSEHSGKGHLMWINFGKKMAMKQEELSELLPDIGSVQGVPSVRAVEKGTGKFVAEAPSRAKDDLAAFIKAAGKGAAGKDTKPKKPSKGMHVTARASPPVYGPSAKPPAPPVAAAAPPAPPVAAAAPPAPLAMRSGSAPVFPIGA